MISKQFSEALEVILTEEEIKTLSEENNKRVIERSRVKAKAKKSADSFTRTIKTLDEQIEETAELIDAGKEMRPVDCEWLPDVEVREMYAVRLDTHATLRRRQMDQDERREYFHPKLWDTPSTPVADPENKAAAVREFFDEIKSNVITPDETNRAASDANTENTQQELASPEVLHATLALVMDREIPSATIKTWTEDQRREAQDWAVAACAAANDNDVKVPEMPAFLVLDLGHAAIDEFTAPRCEECGMIDGGHAQTCSQSNKLTYRDYEDYAKATKKTNPASYARKAELNQDPKIDAKVMAWKKENAPKGRAAEATV